MGSRAQCRWRREWAPRLWLGAAIVLAACAGQREPAQHLIGEIDALLTAASPDAAKYMPDQLVDVQRKFEALKASFASQDYAAVLTAAPAVLGAAQALGEAAAAKKDATMRGLEAHWKELAARLPDNTAAIQSRIDLLGRYSSKKLAAGIDLAAAKDRLSGAQALWSKAQAAYATGNLDEGVTTAGKVDSELDGLAQTLRLDLTVPAHLKTPGSPR
jgi:hypothetical protein